MKTTHFLYASLMVLGMSLGSCSSELDAPAVNGDGNVTFTAQLPGNIGSRAYADGETATTLKYAVYEAGTTNLVFSSDDATPAYTYENLTFKISFNLVKGKSYDFAFWAQAADAPYTFTADATGVTVAMNYDKDATANNEKRDAFFNVEKGLKVEGSVNKTIELRRPFAQLNIGTNDLAEFEATKSVLGNISVTVKDVYNTLDLFSGVASDPKEVTFTDVKPEGEAFPNVKDGKKYDYLAMDYILTGTELVTEADVNNAQKETKDVTIAIFEEGKAEAINTIPVSAAPFQRNYRTNIYGSLLTSTVDWTIEIKPGFNDPDNNVEAVDPGKVKMNGKEYKDITEALQAAEGTEAVLTLGEGEYTLPATFKVGALSSVTIEGTAAAKLSFPESGTSVDAEGMAVAMKGVTYSTSNLAGPSYAGIKAASETYSDVTFVDGTLTPMSPKLVIENSSFTVNPKAGLDDQIKYALSFRNSNVPCEATISNTTFKTHMGTAVTAYHSMTNLTFDNCKFENTFTGDALKDAQSCIVYANADKTRYTHTLAMNNCLVTGFLGHYLSDSKLWACKSGEMTKVTIDGEEQVQPIVSTTDKKNFTLYTPSALTLVSAMVNKGYWRDGAIEVERFKGKNVKLGANIDMTGIDFEPIGSSIIYYPSYAFAGTFDGKDFTIENLKASSNTSNYAAAGLFGGLIGSVKNVVLKNVNINSTHYAGGIAGFVDNNTGVVIDNCKVIGGTITSTAEQINGSWDNGDKVGGILGYGCNYSDKVTNCTVEGLTLTAYRDCGSIVGCAGKLSNVTGNTAKNNTLVWDNTNNYKGYTAPTNFGEVVGRTTGTDPLDPSNTHEGITLPE